MGGGGGRGDESMGKTKECIERWRSSGNDGRNDNWSVDGGGRSFGDRAAGRGVNGQEEGRLVVREGEEWIGWREGPLSKRLGEYRGKKVKK